MAESLVVDLLAGPCLDCLFPLPPVLKVLSAAIDGCRSAEKVVPLSRATAVLSLSASQEQQGLQGKFS